MKARRARSGKTGYSDVHARPQRAGVDAARQGDVLGGGHVERFGGDGIHLVDTHQVVNAQDAATSPGPSSPFLDLLMATASSANSS